MNKEDGEGMIVITDMVMPSCCRMCQFAEPKFHDGIVTLGCGTRTGVQMFAPNLIYRNDRPDWCPLKELPDEKQNWSKEISSCPPCSEKDIDEALNEMKQAMEEVVRIRCGT